MIDWGREGKIPLKEFFSHLQLGEDRNLYTSIEEFELLIVGIKTKKGLILVCSNEKNSKKVLKAYRKRWAIETCFRNIKTQGFNLENTHMTSLERLMKLMAIIALAILVVSLLGIHHKPPLKKGSPLYSLFTTGLRLIKQILLKPILSKLILNSLDLIESEG